MSRPDRLLLAFALLASASFARADALRVLAPAEGATLRGGSFAELRWSAVQLPAASEEWEAFLSIDGGKYYAFRVTPHLDIDLHRFVFIVPNVDTHDARILIRTGDEVHETHFETGGTFSIARDANAEQPFSPLLQSGRGESARDGDPAVVSWVDGQRNGSGLSQQSAPAAPSPSLQPLTTIATDGSPVLPPAGGKCVVSPAIASSPRSARAAHARATEVRPRSADLLLVCRRRNI